MSLDRINVGLVGCGNAGRNIHMRLLGEHSDLYEVVCCADVVTASAEKLASDFGLRAVGSVGDLLAEEDVELVVVATKPPRTHRDVALEAFSQGKHVVVEKPMAGTSEECEEMIAAAESADRLLGVHHNRRWDVDFLRARHAIESGAVGSPVLVRNEYTAGFAGSPYDWGIHLVDQTMALSFGDPFVEMAAAFCSPNVDNPAASEGFFTCRLRTGNGVLHDLSMLPPFAGNAFLPGRMGFRFVVAGTKGTLYQEWCQRPEDAFVKPGVFQASDDGPGLAELPSVSANLAVPDFYESLHKAIQQGAPVPVSGKEGCRAVRAWELMAQSACEGKTLEVKL